MSLVTPVKVRLSVVLPSEVTPEKCSDIFSASMVVLPSVSCHLRDVAFLASAENVAEAPGFTKTLCGLCVISSSPRVADGSGVGEGDGDGDGSGETNGAAEGSGADVMTGVAAGAGAGEEAGEGLPSANAAE